MELQKTTLQEQLKLTREMEQAEDRLQRLQQDIEKRELRMQCKDQEERAGGERDGRILGLVEKLAKGE